MLPQFTVFEWIMLCINLIFNHSFFFVLLLASFGLSVPGLAALVKIMFDW